MFIDSKLGNCNVIFTPVRKCFEYKDVFVGQQLHVILQSFASCQSSFFSKPFMFFSNFD